MVLKLNIDNSGFSLDKIERIANRLEPRIKQLNDVLRFKNYGDEASSILLPSDKGLLDETRSMAKRFKDVDAIVVVGIGGSNLGTVAVQEAVLGKEWNLLNTKKQIFFADTVDSDSINDIIKIIKNKKRVAINVISKSGSTTETIANFEVLLKSIKTNKNNIVITTDAGSKLEKLARSKGYLTLTIPNKVGGRYSVFSAVGLFPLAVLGIDINRLLKGAEDMRKLCLDPDWRKNPAVLISSLLYLHNETGKRIHDSFFWSKDLESVGKWYRQLMGESIGKEWNKDHTSRVFAGITPTVSIGSIDLHSMAQLYLGGPKDKFFRFVTVDKNNAKIIVPNMKEFDQLVEGIQGKPLDKIMKAIIGGVKSAFINKKLPFIEINLPDKSEYSIGQLLQLEMIEMIYLGYLLDVNPFDQPNVEDYKEETRRILRGR